MAQHGHSLLQWILCSTLAQLQGSRSTGPPLALRLARKLQ